MIEDQATAESLAVKTSNLAVSGSGVTGRRRAIARKTGAGAHSLEPAFLVGGCLRTPLVDYVNVTVDRNDTPTQQAAGAYVRATHPHQGFY